MKGKLERKVEIIIKHLGLDEIFIPECGGNYSPECNKEGDWGQMCSHLEECKKEINTRMELALVEKEMKK